MYGISFKRQYELEKRRGESARIREKFPDRIPLIVEKAEGSDIKDIDMKRYLVPADLTASQLVCVIRKRIKLNAEEPIFIFVDNVLPSTGAIVSSIYDEKKDEDGFLYVTYSGKDTLSNIDGEGTPSNGQHTLSNIDGENTLSGGEHTLSNIDGENESGAA